MNYTELDQLITWSEALAPVRAREQVAAR